MIILNSFHDLNDDLVYDDDGYAYDDDDNVFNDDIDDDFNQNLDSDLEASSGEECLDINSHTNKTSNKITLKINRTIASHKMCVICGEKHKKLKLVINRAILDCYLKTNILIPFGCRACGNHLNEFRLITEDSIKNVKVYANEISLKSSDLKLTMEFLRFSALKNSLFERFNDKSTLAEDLCQSITGNKSIF